MRCSFVSTACKSAVLAFLGLALFALPAGAQDDEAGPFSAGSEANSWSLFGEQKALFSGKVTDALCAVAGDCPADCGGGARAMGILRDADGQFVLALKNGQTSFNGASVDLAAFCNKQVDVDGLLIGDPDFTPTKAKFYQVQRIREAGGEWTKANRWTKDWEQRNPDAKGSGPWFRRDPAVNQRILAEGYLGLGLETDAEFKKYLFGE